MPCGYIGNLLTRYIGLTAILVRLKGVHLTGKFRAGVFSVTVNILVSILNG